MSHSELPQNPEWLLTNLGAPPRDPSVLKSIKIILMKWFCPGRLRDSTEIADLHFHLDGIATWSMLIKAHRDAFSPQKSDERFLGVALVAPQLSPEQALKHLPPIAHWIRSNRGARDGGWSDEVSAFMDEVDNDIFRDARLIPVPDEISGGVECSLVTAIFPVNRMPGRVLAMDALPMLLWTDKANESFALLVEPQYWDKAYKQSWLIEAKEMKRASKATTSGQPQKQESTILYALEVKGIPPEFVYTIEAAVSQRCEKQQLKCLFLNVGSLCDEHKIPLPRSGDLQFLGIESQCADVASLLSQILREHLSEEDMQHIHLSSCDLEEFFDRFGWLMDEIEQRQKGVE
ncbi:hypothetical protein [Prosthecobacter sp.]|uniref:hypothetical protein n=1 Tax=Prosthecobacter sp. TaxID=1965333 RepID=UPI003784E3B8